MAGLAPLAAAAMLLCGLALPLARRWPTMVVIQQIQSAALAVAAAAQGLFFTALLVAGIGSWALPWAMRRFAPAPAVAAEAGPHPALLLALGGVLAAAAMLAAPAPLAAPLSLLLLGLLALGAGVPPAMALAGAAGGLMLAALQPPLLPWRPELYLALAALTGAALRGAAG